MFTPLAQTDRARQGGMHVVDVAEALPLRERLVEQDSRPLRGLC